MLSYPNRFLWSIDNSKAKAISGTISNLKHKKMGKGSSSHEKYIPEFVQAPVAPGKPISQNPIIVPQSERGNMLEKSRLKNQVKHQLGRQ
jgi:hypothetical protein